MVPSWDEVESRVYVPWDEERDGQRLVVDMTDADEGITGARAFLAAEGGNGPVWPTMTVVNGVHPSS